MKNILSSPALLFCVLFAASMAQSQARFTSGPSIVKNGDSVAISFEVSASTDVEVAVLGPDSIVVRHLAAGVLGGEFAPPEPLAAGLTQRVVWDGKNDAGEPVFGPVEFRVRLGLRPVLKRHINVLPEITKANMRRFENWPTLVKTADGRDSIAYLGNYWGVIDTARYLNPQGDYIDLYHPLFQSRKYPMGPTYEHRTELDLEVDDVTDDVYVHGQNTNSGGDYPNAAIFHYNRNTGALVKKISFTRAMFSVDSFVGNAGYSEPMLSWDRQYFHYINASHNAYFRFDRNGLPAPWPQTGSHIVRWNSGLGSGDIHSEGHAAAPDGSMYVINYRAVVHTYTVAFGVTRIKDGVAQVNVLDSLECSLSGGIQVDPKGFIYLGTNLRPNGKYVPDFVVQDSLNDSVPSFIPDSINNKAYPPDPRVLFTQKRVAHELYGSIAKMRPDGGVLVQSASTAAPYTGGSTAQNKYIDARGVEWTHYGLSHVLVHGGMGGCWCNQIRFDIDKYGRIFYPNTFNYEMCAMDNNRNAIYRVKNREVPGLALSVGHQVRATDRGLYITDAYRNRVAVFDWATDAEQRVGLDMAADASPSSALRPMVRSAPNPFSAAASILVNLPSTDWNGRALTMRVFDMRGRLVRELSCSPGKAAAYRFNWDARDAQGRPAVAGAYTLRLSYGKETLTHRLTLLR